MDQSPMKNRRTHNLFCRTGLTARKLIFLSLLAAGSLILVTGLHALSGNPEGESRVPQPIATTRSAATISVPRLYPGQPSTPTAGELVAAVVANELADREQLRKWIWMIEKRVGKETLTEEQVETRD